MARVCQAIAANPADARRLTIKRNTVAVVTDGSAVLGLGNLGAAAAMPVMEGKAALFKRFAGVDAWPVCLDTQDTEEIIRTVQILAPGYGGINLEDIAAPRCFEIEARLRELLDIPVFHDDQHGTAVVVLAALRNALKVVGKKLSDCRIVVCGVGAAGSAMIRLLRSESPGEVLAVDIDGIVHPGGPGWLPYIFARAFVDGPITTHSFTEDKVRDPAIRPLMSKLKVIVDDALEAMLPRMVLRVIATTTDGKAHQVEIVDPLATPTTRCRTMISRKSSRRWRSLSLGRSAAAARSMRYGRCATRTMSARCSRCSI